MAKISLCCITGNCEEYIDRFLKSFAPVVDEICLVRAIGSSPPDATLEIARSRFGVRFGEYVNKPGHESWPHVDDFAAARQQSFDMATGDYILWADTDDVLDSGAEIIREHAERGGYPVFVYPYAISGKGMMVPRERLILKGSGKWHFPVHEAFEFLVQPVSGVEDNRVVIRHLPHLTKGGSNERNLRILRSIPDSEMTTGLLYHMHLELAVSDDIPGSIEVAKRVLARPDLGRPEKMELFLNLAQTTKDPNQKHALLHQAYAADPRRREALMMLCNTALNCGDPESGLAYARQMMATPIPKFTEWNERAPIYGWVGDDMFAQALRSNQMFQEAEAVRVAAINKYGHPRIALLHATRGRPEKAALARKLWLDLAEKPELIEHIFALDDDDRESDCLRRFSHVRLPGDGGCVAAWNLAAADSIAPVMVQLSDDWTPIPQWDKLILERIGDVEKPRVLAIGDGSRKDTLLCMAICTRSYLFQDYFLFHPNFTGVYSDNWFTELAYRRGVVIEARDIQFTHSQPVFGSAEMDSTYAKQNAPERYIEGAKIIDDLRAGKDWASVPGFFNYWPFYQMIANRLKDGDTIAEIGVWLGRSVIFLAQLLKRQGKRVKILAVDTFAGESGQIKHEQVVMEHGGNFRKAFEANLERCGVADMFEIIQGDSAESAKLVADGTLAFCFIDAAHDYVSVKRDIEAWSVKVNGAGVLAGHDAQHGEVVQAVKETLPKAIIGPVIWCHNFKQ